MPPGGVHPIRRRTAFKHLAFLVDRAPQIDHLTIELGVNVIEMPAPLAEASHLANSLAPDVCGEQRPEPVLPHSHRLVAEVDPALE